MGNSWGTTVGAALALQWAVIASFALLAWIGFGAAAGQSLLFGGIAVAVPNAALALWLTLRRLRTGTLGIGAMLGGEVLKVALTIALIVICVKALGAQVVWLAVIVGVVAALKAQWLAVWFTRNF